MRAAVRCCVQIGASGTYDAASPGGTDPGNSNEYLTPGYLVPRSQSGENAAHTYAVVEQPASPPDGPAERGPTHGGESDYLEPQPQYLVPMATDAEFPGFTAVQQQPPLYADPDEQLEQLTFYDLAGSDQKQKQHDERTFYDLAGPDQTQNDARSRPRAPTLWDRTANASRQSRAQVQAVQGQSEAAPSPPPPLRPRAPTLRRAAAPSSPPPLRPRAPTLRADPARKDSTSTA